MAEHTPVADPKMERRVIPGTIETVFEFDYSVQAEDMRSLYEKAKRDQWNASRDIAWDTPEPSDGRVLSDELVDIHGSPIWARLSEKDRVDLNRRIAAWRLWVLVYGEQGALLACSQMVDIVQGTDEKFFQATQVMDEARHNEVLERYIQTRLGGLHYPMPENERVL
ncbi:MAG TPA: diiron oxygenase, partial [Methylomirabilota bacterium]|nr:diiron oxygenase [Methylomirabilota bacterium]